MLKKDRIIHEQTGIIDYQRKEIQKLEANLKKLSDGDLSIDLEVSEGHDDTRADREHFINLNRYIQKVKESVDGIVKDTGDISSNMKEGNIDYRLDTTKYSGVFSKSEETLILRWKLYRSRFMQFSGNINSLISRLLSVQDAFVRVSNGDLKPQRAI